MYLIIHLFLFQDSRGTNEEQALNSSSFDGSNDLIELSDDDEFDEAMAEVIFKLCLHRDISGRLFCCFVCTEAYHLVYVICFWFGTMMCIFFNCINLKHLLKFVQPLFLVRAPGESYDKENLNKVCRNVIPSTLRLLVIATLFNK